jgi:hypothetical protein
MLSLIEGTPGSRPYESAELKLIVGSKGLEEKEAAERLRRDDKVGDLLSGLLIDLWISALR